MKASLGQQSKRPQYSVRACKGTSPRSKTQTSVLAAGQVPTIQVRFSPENTSLAAALSFALSLGSSAGALRKRVVDTMEEVGRTEQSKRALLTQQPSCSQRSFRRVCHHDSVVPVRRHHPLCRRTVEDPSIALA